MKNRLEKLTENKIFAFLRENAKHILYAVCIAFLVLIWQREETADYAAGWREAFRDMAGFCVAGLILPHISLDRVKKYKIPFGIWSVVAAVLVGLGIFLPIFDTNLLADRIVLYGEAAIWSGLTLYTLISVFAEKKYARLNWWFMALWGFMEFWMIISRSDYKWPLAFGGMFVIFYLTDFSLQEERDITKGMMNGLILAFFCIQGWSLLYRPYDVYRYQGAFTNSSQTALFFLFVLAAVYGKLVFVTRVGAHRFWKLFYWFGACVVLAFLVMPVSRLGWAVGVLFTTLFLIVYSFQRGKSYVIRFGLLMLVLTIALVPVCYIAVRYIPPLRHHPVWFSGEYSESRVHSWDPIDSEKYRSWDQFLESISWRLKETMEALESTAEISFVAYAKTDDADGEKEKKDPTKYTWEEIPVEGSKAWKKWANSLPVDIEEAGDGTKSRFQLYEYCFHKMNLRGYKLSEQPFWLSHFMFAYHCHDIFLQFGTDFGWPVFYVFILICLITLFVLLRDCIREIKQESIREESVTRLLIFLIPMTFGAMEYCWGTGSLAVILMYIIWRWIAANGKKYE